MNLLSILKYLLPLIVTLCIAACGSDDSTEAPPSSVTPTIATTPTATATPTYTPTPVPDYSTIVDDAIKSMKSLDFYHAEATMAITLEAVGLEMEIPLNITQDYAVPAKTRSSLDASFLGEELCAERITIGTTKYEKDCDSSSWDTSRVIYDSGQFFAWIWGGGNLESPPVWETTKGSIDAYDGLSVYVIELINAETDISVLNAFGFTDEDSQHVESSEVTMIIDRKSNHIVQFTQTMESPDAEAVFGAELAGASFQISLNIQFSRFNEEVSPPILPIDEDLTIGSASSAPLAAPTAPPDAPTATDFYSIYNSDLAASSTPNTICDRNSIDYGHSWTPLLYDTNPLEMRAGETYQTIGYGSLPNQLCVHYYSFQAVMGVNYSISVDVDSEDLSRTGLIYLYDQNYWLWEINDDRISFTAEDDGTYYFLVGEMGENIIHEDQITAPPLHYQVQVSKESSEATPAPTPQPTATPDPAASSTPNLICGNLSDAPLTSQDFWVAMMLADSFEIQVGAFHQTTGTGQSLPNSTCVHKYAFQAEQGVSYAISAYVHSEGLTMLSSWLELWDRHDNFIDFNVDYANESLGSRIFFTAKYDGLYYFLVGEMDYSASNSTYRVQVFKKPSERKLVFISDVTGTRELFLSALDDNSIMQLTDNGYATNDSRFELDQVSNYESKEARSEKQPVFSPDGKVIAYVSNAKGNDDIYFDISFGQSDAGQFITSQSTSDPGNDTHPSWHPSGDYLAFTTNRNGKAEIYLVNLSNNLLDEQFLVPGKFEKEPLIQMSERHAYSPEYSPDGTLVAFTSELVSGDGLADIYIHNIGTGENTNITNTDMANVGQHDWSSDGSKLIFRADPDATDTYHPSQLEIFTIHKDGSNLVQITNNEKLDASPKWSEDDTSIYFVSHENQEQPKIYVMDADGSNERRATTLSSSVQEIYFDIYE